jgi:hypothetical protein
MSAAFFRLSTTIIATPYGYVYDTVCVAIAIALIATSARRVAPSEEALMALAWMWPGLAVWASFLGLQPLGCVLIAALLWLGFRRLHEEPLSAQSQHLVRPNGENIREG